jgi:hypothetical protein
MPAIITDAPIPQTLVSKVSRIDPVVRRSTISTPFAHPGTKQVPIGDNVHVESLLNAGWRWDAPGNVINWNVWSTSSCWQATRFRRSPPCQHGSRHCKPRRHAHWTRGEGSPIFTRSSIRHLPRSPPMSCRSRGSGDGFATSRSVGRYFGGSSQNPM